MLSNTKYFREAALHWLKYGFYCNEPRGTPGYKNYWDRELDRCINGYSVGGIRITGHHYFYLNYVQFLKFVAEGVPKQVGFPDFWDGDYEFFHLFEKAGAVGKHVIAAKARRKGYSLKMAAIAANTYNTIPSSNVILGAHEAKYLYPDGIMTMAVDNLSFLNDHTAWTKRRQKINQQKHVKASFLVENNGAWIERGYKSQIQAITYQDNPDAARGKNANVLIMDECGAFDNLKAAMSASKPCVEAGGVATGIMVLFGTGGDMAGGTIDFESMFYSPEEYDFMAVPNEWDEAATSATCGFFHPSYKNKEQFMDADGNSLVEKAKASDQAKRDHIKRTAKDPITYDKHVTEYPFTPKEAFLRIGHNMFPVVELSEWRNKIEASQVLSRLGTHGEMYYDEKGKPQFRASPKARPVLKFPHDRNMDITGCITIYQAPFRKEGNVPHNLYYIMHDPYAGDTDGGTSLGATYVKKRVNAFSSPDDMIVAAYVGRPKFQDHYNHQMFALAEYYNAMISFENDRGDVIPYAKRHKKLGWLYEEFELFDKDNNFQLKKLGRKFGTSMGTGTRKRQAEVYGRDWLLTARGKDEDGNQKLNLHTIYDIGLLDELIRYDPVDKNANFDRVSAFLVGQFAEKDLHNRVVRTARQQVHSNFFDREFF